MSSKQPKLEEFPSSGNRYTLLDCLGSGAFGKVFTAIDTQASNKHVAVKIQKLNENNRNYIEQEYKVLRDLSSHVNLPDFYGIYKNEDDVWFVMEICEGGPVIDVVNCLLAQNRRMREEHIAYILKETVKAVTFLHEKCTIHRDIKGRNILLTKEGEVKLVDFGFSCSIKNVLDKTDGCVGSPCWMAPEIIICKRSGEKYGNRVDVWSLGITAIELADGKAPYQSMHPTRTLFQIVNNPPPTLYRTTNWSENFVDFITECLVKNPEHRPYVQELLDHPLITQIPENSYHLTLELKSLLSDINKLDLPKAGPESAITDNHLKRGADGDLETLLIEDLATLDEINEKSILELLEARMKNGNFQTFVGDVLLILNPNEKRDIYDIEYHSKYRLKSRSENAPHIYSVADSAYQYALHHQIPQRIILSGESGSGKTTNYLHLIDHLLYLGHNENINLQRIKDAVKLIHSLIHASTPINNYSTRSVFKTDIKYGNTGNVSGAIFNVYQVEKWRISSVDSFQGNFHFLYYVYDGIAKNKKLEQYQLNHDRNYRYLRTIDDEKSNSPKFNINKNLKKFKKIVRIFEDFEIGEEEIDTIFSIVSAILNVGEIHFEETDSGEAVTEDSDKIEKVCQLLKIDPKKFEWALTNYCVVQKSTVIRRKSTADEARDARDVFANNLFTRLVDYIVATINHRLVAGRQIFGEKYSIQSFDYFGFECFKTNHLPQLFVNVFNEQLQYHYLQRVFSWEYLDAQEEELEYQPVSFYENRKCLDELLNKSDGIFSIIDEASKSGHHGDYVSNYLQDREKKFVYASGQSEFSVAHYTGKVNYNAKEMPDKNRDFLPPEIVETLRLSDDPIVKLLFTNKLNKTGNLIVSFDQEDEVNRGRYKFQTEKSSHQYSQIRKMRTCIHTFKALSLELLKELSIGSGSGGTHFVRCIRSDLKGEIENFDRKLVKQQIRALAVTETARARQKGYPHRISFQEFLRRYQFLAFDFDENVEIDKDNCRLLLIRLKMEGWNIGKSKVFLKYYNEEYLARLYETQVKKIIKVQSILRRFLAKCLVAREMREHEICVISTIGKHKKHRMTEEEAAAIIQKAYRESTIRKSYPEFAKDYKVLDEETCDFIRPFAKKWRQNSIFHVLVLYRAFTFQESYNFTQQVHLYNIGVFYELQQLSEDVSLEIIDAKAQVSNWLSEPKLPIRKIPFRLDEIPFYDTSGMRDLLINSGVSIEKDDSWDMPYRWRELVSSKSDTIEEVSRDEDDMITIPYTRDPLVPVREIPEAVENKSEKLIKFVVEEFISKEHKEEENQIRKKITEEEINIIESSLGNKVTEKEKTDENKINSDTQLANKDFDYIRPPVLNKPKTVDPIVELKQISPRNVSEDDPPFNFQGMLRKTNFQKVPAKQNEEQVPIYSLKKRQNKVKNRFEDEQNKRNKEENSLDVNDIIENSTEKIVRVELAPGIIVEGVEVEL